MRPVSQRFLRRQAAPESGFTLIELLVVILIIGVLAAIAVPMFLNQRKSAVEVSLKSDLRNAATMMQTEHTKTGKFPPALPNYSQLSDGNVIALVGSASSPEAFCLLGVNKALDERLYWSTAAEGFSPSCETLPEGQSFNAMNSTKKIVVVRSPSEYLSLNYMKDVLVLQGYNLANITEVPADTLTDAHLKDADLLLLINQAWSAKHNDLEAAYRFYEKGGDVFLEGNDNRPYYFSNQRQMGKTGIDFKPTNNQLTPAFPYSFDSEGFPADSWVCVDSLMNGAISIATDEVEGHTCHTMFGATSAAGGQFFYLVYINAKNTNKEFSQAHAGLAWLSN